MTITLFDEIIGKTFTKIEVLNQDSGNDEIRFTISSDEVYIMHHVQDCCEHVIIKDINGDIQRLIGSPVLLAECVQSDPKDVDGEEEMWTYYKLATKDEHVVISWYGTHNGYYSVEVDFYNIKEGRKW